MCQSDGRNVVPRRPRSGIKADSTEQLYLRHTNWRASRSRWVWEYVIMWLTAHGIMGNQTKSIQSLRPVLYVNGTIVVTMYLDLLLFLYWKTCVLIESLVCWHSEKLERKQKNKINFHPNNKRVNAPESPPSTYFWLDRLVFKRIIALWVSWFTLRARARGV